MESFPKNENEKTNKSISRRDFLKKAGEGFLGLSILGSSALNSEAQNANPDKNKTEEYLMEIDKIITEFVKEDNFLSKREIQKELEGCGFIENINIQELEIINLSGERNTLKESLDQSLINKRLILKKDELNIIQMDFDDIGPFDYGAFYDNEYKSMFINQVKNSFRGKRGKIENLIIEKIIFFEQKRIMNIIFDLDISNKEKEQKFKLLLEEVENFKKNTKNIKDLSDLISLHFEKIKNFLNEITNKEKFEHIITKTNLQHEAFHYFFINQLEKDGYEGPSVEELLAIAIRGKVRRFGDDDPDYAQIRFDIDEININNQEELLNFCKKINEGYNLINVFEDEISEETLKKLKENNDLIPKYYLSKNLSLFLEEYWARVYNGAHGNTAAKVKAELHESLKSDDNYKKLNFEYIYHEPTSEELAILSKMKWKGRPILGK